MLVGATGVFISATVTMNAASALVLLEPFAGILILKTPYGPIGAPRLLLEAFPALALVGEGRARAGE